MDSQLTTPVLFLIFNRPDTTAQVFEEIRRAQPPRLYIAADGPRFDKPGEAEKVEQTRNIVLKGIDWPCEVETLFRDENLGCKQAVSGGLDWFFENEEAGIILEDDCVPHPTFFDFCAELLTRYRDDERIMMISGTNYLQKFEVNEGYIFSRYFAIWGWATWSRAWQHYDSNMTGWPELKTQRYLDSLYSQRFQAQHLTKMFDLAHANLIDTWDIPWFYSCLFNHGLSIVPRVNLISNIGYLSARSPQPGSPSPFLAAPTFGINLEGLQHPQRVYADINYDTALFEKIAQLGRKARIISLKYRLNRISYYIINLLRKKATT